MRGAQGESEGAVASGSHCLCGSEAKHLMVDLGPELGSRSSGQENERAIKWRTAKTKCDLPGTSAPFHLWIWWASISVFSPKLLA